MAKKKKSQQRQERLIRFRQEILPDLQQHYEVQAHGPTNAPATMYKIIIHSSKSYDFYPMSEKMRININDEYTWRDFSLDEMAAKIDHLKLVR